MKATEGKELSADIIGANSCTWLYSYNSYAYNGIQQYRMVKGELIPTKCLRLSLKLKKIEIL